MTALDLAHAAMEAAPDDPLPRLRFYETLIDGELVLWLAADPAPGANPVPALFDTVDGRLALVFDSEERLASFAESAAPYAAMPGRTLIGMMRGQGIGLGLNLGVAPSSFLMSAASVDWLAQTLATAPLPASARPLSLAPPGLAPPLIAALDRKLARAEGLAQFALLSAATWADKRSGHLLAVVGSREGAEETLARAIGEALIFAGQDQAALDIVFLAPDDPLVSRIARQALRFDLPTPQDPHNRVSPGSDPERPPRLR